jgi:hypothetical protein
MSTKCKSDASNGSGALRLAFGLRVEGYSQEVYKELHLYNVMKPFFMPLATLNSSLLLSLFRQNIQEKLGDKGLGLRSRLECNARLDVHPSSCQVRQSCTHTAYNGHGLKAFAQSTLAQQVKGYLMVDFLIVSC